MYEESYENVLGQAIDALVYELGLSSPSQLWDAAGVTTNRATWYKRVAPDSKVPTNKKQLDKLINGLEANGYRLSEEQKERLHLAIGIQAVKQQEIVDRIIRLEALKDPDRQRLLDARLANFVPDTRQEELTYVISLIEQLQSTGGYLTITGLAGEGKTTLVAQLIMSKFGREQTPYHIIPFNPGRDHQVTLLRSLMAPLVLKHPYLPDYWSQIFHRDTLAGIFANMLAKIAEKGEHEVIFIDGLDQIKPDARAEERDLDFLPPKLGNGIVIVLSTRPDDTLKPLQSHSPLQEYKLPKLGRADTDRVLNHYGIHLPQDVVDQLYRDTRQNALYIHLVVEELAQARAGDSLQALKRVSSNPDNIFSLSFNRIKQFEIEWRTVIKPMLGLLLTAQEPLSVPAIGQILDADEEVLRDGLQRLGGLVEQDGKGKHYLYHLKLQEYLREDESNPGKSYIISRKEERQRHKQIADWCAGNDIAGGKIIWQDTGDAAEQERREYARQHYITHLYHAHERSRLFALLDASEYGQAKMQYDPSMRSYAQDLEFGQRAVAWETATFEENIQYLPNLWRYTLLRCWLVTRAKRYPREALHLLLLLGEETKALGLAELMANQSYKAEILQFIATYWAMRSHRNASDIHTLNKVSIITGTIADIYLRTEALRRLKEPQTQEIERVKPMWALEAEKELQDLIAEQEQLAKQEWEKELQDLKERLTTHGLAGSEHWTEVKAQQVRSLRELGVLQEQYLTHERARETWLVAERATYKILDGEIRVQELEELRKVLVQALEWEGAERVMRAIEKNHEKNRQQREALREFVRILQARRWEEVESLIGVIEWNGNQPIRFLYLLTIEMIRAQVWDGAERVTNIIQDDKTQANAQRELSKALVQAQEWVRAERVGSTIQDRTTRTNALDELSMTLIQAQELLEAERVINTIQDSRTQAKASYELSMALIQAQEWIRAEQVINAVKDDKTRAKALNGLSKALIQAQELLEAERVINTIQDSGTQAEALCELGIALAHTQELERARTVWGNAERAIHAIKDNTLQREVERVIDTIEDDTWSKGTHVKTIKDDTARVKAWCKLGIALVQAKERERAREIWREVERAINTIQDDYWLVLCKLGVVLVQAQRWAESERVINTVKDGEAQAKALRKLSIALAQTLSWEEAERVINTIQDNETQAEALCELGLALAQNQKWEEAERVINTIQDNETQAETLCGLGLALARSQKQEQAREVWLETERVINTIKDNNPRTRVLVNLSVALMQAQEWGEAQRIYSTIKDPYWQARMMGTLSKKLVQAKEFEQARKVQSEAVHMINAIPNQPWYEEGKVYVLIALSTVLVEVQEREQAKETWKMAEHIARSIPRFYDMRKLHTLVEVCRVLIQAGEWAEAERVITETIWGENIRSELLSDLSVALVEAGEWAEAERVVKSIDYDKNKGLHKLSKTFARAGKWAEAEHFISMIEYSYQRAWALNDLGLALMQAHELEQARVIWRKAESVINTIGDEYKRAQMLSRLSEAWMQAHELEQARVIWRETERLLDSIYDNAKRVDLACQFSRMLARQHDWEQLLFFVQKSWRDYGQTWEAALQLFSSSCDLISLKPEMGIAFSEAVLWVNSFLQR